MTDIERLAESPCIEVERLVVDTTECRVSGFDADSQFPHTLITYAPPYGGDDAPPVHMCEDGSGIVWIGFKSRDIRYIDIENDEHVLVSELRPVDPNVIGLEGDDGQSLRTWQQWFLFDPEEL